MSLPTSRTPSVAPPASRILRAAKDESQPDAAPADDVGTLPVASTPESDRPEDGWSLITLVPHDGKEPPASVLGRSGPVRLVCGPAIWHPSLLARARELPRIESIESPTSPGPREVRVNAAGAGGSLPSGYRTQAEDAGALRCSSRGRTGPT